MQLPTAASLMNWLSARIITFIIAIHSTSFCAHSMQSVAIIGGGISGLSCAQFLRTSSKYVPTVFDTGRLRPGGRCSARLPTDATADAKDGILSSCVVDHATQIIRVPEGFTEFRGESAEKTRNIEYVTLLPYTNIHTTRFAPRSPSNGMGRRRGPRAIPPQLSLNAHSQLRLQLQDSSAS